MKTSLLYYLALIYFVKHPPHISGVFITHHQEVITVFVQQLLRVIGLGDWQLPAPDVGQQIPPKYLEIV
jgi:hypothetical protein